MRLFALAIALLAQGAPAHAAGFRGPGGCRNDSAVLLGETIPDLRAPDGSGTHLPTDAIGPTGSVAREIDRLMQCPIRYR